MTCHILDGQDELTETHIGHDSERLVSIVTRFGTVEFDRAQAITFPRSIPGFAGYGEFGLCRIPDCDAPNLMLLQSIEPQDLAFIVMSLEPDSGLYDEEDIETANHHLGIEIANSAIILIVSFQQIQGDQVMCVNLRAPVIIDTANRLAWQYILPNDRYPVRHVVE